MGRKGHGAEREYGKKWNVGIMGRKGMWEYWKEGNARRKGLWANTSVGE